MQSWFKFNLPSRVSYWPTRVIVKLIEIVLLCTYKDREQNQHIHDSRTALITLENLTWITNKHPSDEYTDKGDLCTSQLLHEACKPPAYLSTEASCDTLSPACAVLPCHHYYTAIYCYFVRTLCRNALMVL